MTTIGAVTAVLSRTVRGMGPPLARAGDWLRGEVTAGRVAGGRPAPELVRLTRLDGEVTAGSASSLASALGTAHELIREMIGPEPDFTAVVPYNDLDTLEAAHLCPETAAYLAAGQGGGVSAPPRSPRSPRAWPSPPHVWP